MGMITYLTDVCERLSESPCLDTGFVMLIFIVSPPLSNRSLIWQDEYLDLRYVLCGKNAVKVFQTTVSQIMVFLFEVTFKISCKHWISKYQIYLLLQQIVKLLKLLAEAALLYQNTAFSQDCSQICGCTTFWLFNVKLLKNCNL